MKRFFLIALIMLVSIMQVSADSKEVMSRIEINIPSRTLSLYKDGMLFKEYPVCVGKQSTPTPQGEFKVVYKTVNPYWINKESVVPPGPQNPLGIRWIGITKGIGIHGNNKPNSIGTYASSGCIRMYNRDVQEVYTLVPVNTPVLIEYDRVRLFEDEYAGNNAIVIYPDYYKAGSQIKERMQEKLRQMDVAEEIAEKAQKVLSKSYSKPIAVSKGIGIFLNNSLITCDAMEEGGEIYINNKAAEDVLGLTPEIAGLLEIDVKEVDGRIYINLSQVVKKYGGKLSYEKADGSAYISMKIVKVNGVFVGLNLGDYDKTDFLSVECVKQLGYDYTEDTVDLRLFDKGIMKQKKNNVWSINVDSMIEALGGSKSIASQYGAVDLKLPVFLRLDDEYFRTESIDGRLVINRETAYSIYERTGYGLEAFQEQGENAVQNVDLEVFLEDYDYNANDFRTVIDIRVKADEG